MSKVGATAGAVSGTTSIVAGAKKGGLSGILGIISGALIILSVFYQIHQARKQKRIARDRNARREVNPSSSNTNIPFCYGYCSIQSHRVVVDVSNNYQGYLITSYVSIGSQSLSPSQTGQFTITLTDTVLYVTEIFYKLTSGSSSIELPVDFIRLNGSNIVTIDPNYVDGSNNYATIIANRSTVKFEFRYISLQSSQVISNLSVFGGVLGRVNSSITTPDRDYNAFLFRLSVLCMDPISSVATLDINGEQLSKSKFGGYVECSVYRTGGTALGRANSSMTQNLANAKFTNIAYAFEVAFLNRDNPQFNGLPEYRYYIHGRLVRTLSLVSNVATLSTTRTFSNNSVLVLLDYLLDTNAGVGLASSEVDLQSFYNASVIADVTVRTVNNINCKVFNTFNASRVFKKHEFNGVLRTEEPHIDNIDEIMTTIAGGILFKSIDGRVKISIPDQSMTNAQLSRITITDDYLLKDTYITIQSSSTEERLNRITVSFNNYVKDFVSDNIIVENSTYLTADQNVVLSSDTQSDGIDNEFHARYIANVLMAESRFRIYRFSCTFEFIRFEIGDVVLLNSLVNNISNQYVRIVEMVIKEGFEIEFTAVEFNITNYNWATYTQSTTVPSIYEVGAFISSSSQYPSSLTATLASSSNTVFGQVTLSYTVVSPPHYYGHIQTIAVDYSLDSGSTWFRGTEEFITGSTIPTSITYNPTIAGAYRFRVFFTGRTNVNRFIFYSETAETTTNLTVTASGANSLLSGRTLTGSTIQTSGTGSRIVLDTTSLTMYDGSSNKIIEITTS